MRESHPVERAVGMAYYVSDADGIGGRIRDAAADFRVRELEAFDAESLDADPGSYPHVLARATLSGWDTNDFAAELSDRLDASRERVSWAGTKDKRAITTQLLSVADADPDALRAVEISDAEIELVGRTGRPIFFGDLAGNAFEIVVRDADGEGIDAVTDDLRAFAGEESDGNEAGGDGNAADAATVGVPNYFGQQRFGSRRPVTHEVGLAVVRGEWREAVRTYVGNPSDREPDATREARAAVDRALDGLLSGEEGAPPSETAVWEEALDRLPRRLGFERSMCHRLVDRGGDANGDEDGALDAEDYRAALEAVPSNLQTLFVNAAQSYAFNRILSARLERGLPFHEPVAGDVVCFADRSALRAVEQSSGQRPRDADAPDGLALPDTDRTQRVTEDRLSTVRRHCRRGRAFVTAPLVGTDTDLAGGEPGEIERAVLDDLGLAPDDFDLPGEFRSDGTRRAILLRTGLTVEDSGDPQFSFSLPKGSYATVVLREYCKTDPEALG